MATDRITFRSLRHQLRNNRIRSESGGYFVPNVSIASILTLPTIEETILALECSPDDRIGLADRIYNEGRKTFATLILMNEEEYIVKFRDHNLLDKSLPLSEDDAKMVAGNVGIHFTAQQWELLSENFRQKMWENHQEFCKDRVLPFICDSEQVGEGGYGEVVKVNILPSQQAFYPQDASQVQVIRKRLKSKKITREFRNEKMLLRLLNQLQHPNIIRLLGSYTYREEHYFLFPCIDMDLRRFFQRQSRLGNFRHDYTFYSALRGLGSALSNAHSIRLNQEAHGVDFHGIGYHHDIRPANILASQETLLLADFGLGNLKPSGLDSHTPLKSELGDWLAPECVRENDVTRAIDVWAFGCLIAETATYMQRGAKGVSDFSAGRVSPGRRPRWCDSMFYGLDGNAKTEVKEWLKSLANEADCSLISSLVELSLVALIGDVEARPKMTHICHTLTLLSIRAHSVAVQKEFLKHLKHTHTTTTKNIWFLQRRFLAWDYGLGLSTIELSDTLDTANRIHDKSISIMANIVYELETGLQETIETNESQPNQGIDAQYTFENQLDQLVEGLWDLLPSNMQRRAQDYWHQSILCTDDRATLDGIHQKLKSRYLVYDTADAIAKMRKIRLDMLQPDSFQGAIEACTISLKDLEFTYMGCRHALGRYEGDIPVVVEEMSPTSGWEKIHPDQRKLVIDLKARSLSVDPRPKGLRTMECIGAFERSGNKPSYGLVYRYPEGVQSDPVTLLQRLDFVYGKRKTKEYPPLQPILGDKFKLAFALADFLKEFHTIGWLHENFNAKNILFFGSWDDESEDSPTSGGEIRQPYVVGLHKSRPDGSFWQTEGPHIDEDLQDYQHPEYADTGRYRLAFDYYSLGVVLLEIGLWRPLNSWQSKFQNLGMVEVREELLETCRNQLGAKMGGVYRDVTLSCMDGSLETGLDMGDGAYSDGVVLLGNFTKRVVEPLEKLAMASI
ncbi:kinase-like protein [Daldinia bambusicola]|nr:kinase-like protein [Daldinia bambusicola]